MQNTNGQFTATIIKGDPVWTAWEPFTTTRNIISNAIQVEMKWDEIDDALFVQDQPAVNIGVATTDALVPHEWAYSLSPDATVDNWTTTDEPHIWVTPPTGEMYLKIAARDKLANRGGAITAMTILSDLAPPEAGTLRCFINGDQEIASAAGNPAGFITTQEVRYEIPVDGTGSNITKYAYKIGVGAQVAPDPVDAITLVTPISGAGIMKFLVDNTGPTGDPLVQGQDIWLGVIAMDAGGTWTETPEYHCISWLDWEAPSNCSPVHPVIGTDDDNPFIAGIQLNEDSFGGGFNIQVNVADAPVAGRVGLSTVRVKIDSGSWQTMGNPGGAATYTGNYNWSDPGDDADNANGGVTHTLSFEFTDRCGNVKTQNNLITVYVDTTDPPQPTSIVCSNKYTEEDHLSGTKDNQYSYIAVYNDSTPPAVPDVAAMSGGTGPNTDLGYYHTNANLGTNTISIGNSPMRVSNGNIYVYEVDGAGNFSPGQTIYINNPPEITNIVCSGTSGNVNVEVTVWDPDAPDRNN
jgi:hypothetical protein